MLPGKDSADRHACLAHGSSVCHLIRRARFWVHHPKTEERGLGRRLLHEQGFEPATFRSRIPRLNHTTTASFILFFSFFQDAGCRPWPIYFKTLLWGLLLFLEDSHKTLDPWTHVCNIYASSGGIPTSSQHFIHTKKSVICLMYEWIYEETAWIKRECFARFLVLF